MGLQDSVWSGWVRAASSESCRRWLGGCVLGRGRRISIRYSTQIKVSADTVPPTKSLQPTPGSGFSSAARFTFTGPAWLSLSRPKAAPHLMAKKTIDFDVVREIALALPGVEQCTIHGAPSW